MSDIIGNLRASVHAEDFHTFVWPRQLACTACIFIDKLSVLSTAVDTKMLKGKIKCQTVQTVPLGAVNR